MDKRKQIIFGILVLGISIGAVGFFSSVMSVAILGVMFGLGLSFSTIATETYVAEVAKKNKFGASFGGLHSVSDIGQSIGPFITGVAITYISFKAGFIVSLVIAVIAAAVFLLYNMKKGQSL